MTRIDPAELRALRALREREEADAAEPAHAPPPPLVVADDDYRADHADLMARRVAGEARALPHGGDPTAADLRALVASVGARAPRLPTQTPVAEQRRVAVAPEPRRTADRIAAFVARWGTRRSC